MIKLKAQESSSFLSISHFGDSVRSSSCSGTATGLFSVHYQNSETVLVLDSFVLLFHNENMLSSLSGSHPLVSCVFALGVITFPITGVLRACRLYIAEKKF